MAFGAAHADVLRMVLRHGLRLTVLGVAIGLAAAFGVTRLIANLLFVSPIDGVTFTAISALLAIVAMLASLLPARRAAGGSAGGIAAGVLTNAPIRSIPAFGWTHLWRRLL
jgi:putative ABC transport system permease protein